MKLSKYLALALYSIPGYVCAEVSTRTDYTHTIAAGGNYSFDLWLPIVFCDPGTFVKGLRLGIEKVSKAKGIDSIREISLVCGSFDSQFNSIAGNTHFPMSNNSWGEVAWCPISNDIDSHAIGYGTHYATPFKVNSALSYFNLICDDDNLSSIETLNEIEYKKPNPASANCKVNEAICGIQLGIYETIPGAIANSRLACCSTDPK